MGYGLGIFLLALGLILAIATWLVGAAGILVVAAVIGRVRDGRLLLDCRTLDDAEADEVAAAVRSIRG